MSNLDFKGMHTDLDKPLFLYQHYFKQWRRTMN